MTYIHNEDLQNKYNAVYKMITAIAFEESVSKDSVYSNEVDTLMKDLNFQLEVDRELTQLESIYPESFDMLPTAYIMMFMNNKAVYVDFFRTSVPSVIKPQYTTEVFSLN